MKKKLIGLVLLLALVLSLVPTSAFAKNYVEIVPDDYWRDYYDWSYYDYYVEVYDSDGDYVTSTRYGNSLYLDEGTYTARVYYGNNQYYSKTFYYNGSDSRVYLGYNGKYDRYYPYNDSISDVKVYNDRVTGKAAPYAEVTLYNGNGSVKTVTADRNGNFTIYYDFDYYYNYKDYGYWYDLDRYYLRSNAGQSYSLHNYYVDGYYDYNKKLISEPLAGDNYINGSWAYPYAKVYVRDYQDNLLGSTTANRDGSFSISLSRKLVAGEALRITSSQTNYRDKTTTVVVGGINKTEKIVSKFVIGDKTYSQTKYDKTKTEKMDVAPYIENGRTMLPIRYVAEALGYEVNWDEATKNAVFIKGSNTAVVNLYSREIYVNGKNSMLSVMPKTVNGRIMLPVSELGMALGLSHGNYGQGKNIEWQGTTNTVYVTIYE